MTLQNFKKVCTVETAFFSMLRTSIATPQRRIGISLCTTKYRWKSRLKSSGDIRGRAEGRAESRADGQEEGKAD
jgi:hypothetical protein